MHLTFTAATIIRFDGTTYATTLYTIYWFSQVTLLTVN